MARAQPFKEVHATRPRGTEKRRVFPVARAGPISLAFQSQSPPRSSPTYTGHCPDALFLLLLSALISFLPSHLCPSDIVIAMLSLFTILANVAALLLCLALGSAQGRPGWGLSRRAAAAEPARPVTGARYAYPVARRQKRQDQPAGDCPPL